MNNKKLKLFIDMDNVTVALDKMVIQIANEENNTTYDYKCNSSWWWEDYYKIGNVNKKYFENLLHREGVFFLSESVEDSIEYINKLYNEHYDIIFLTSPQWTEDCMVEKVLWLETHFKWFNPDKHLVFTTRKELLSGDNRLLIDDSMSNLDKWNGSKICFGTGCNKDFDGLRAEKWCEVYNLIKLIEREGEM